MKGRRELLQARHAKVDRIKVERRGANGMEWNEISGLASSFLSIIENGDRPRTQMARNCFTNAVNDFTTGKRKLRLFAHHDMYDEWPIGLVTQLKVTMRGLEFRAKIFDESERSMEVLSLIEHDLVNDVSISFYATSYRMNETLLDGSRGRIVDDLTLYEISVVNEGADPRAKIESIAGQSLLTPAQQQFVRDEKIMLAKNYEGILSFTKDGGSGYYNTAS